MGQAAYSATFRPWRLYSAPDLVHVVGGRRPSVGPRGSCPLWSRGNAPIVTAKLQNEAGIAGAAYLSSRHGPYSELVFPGAA